MIYGPICYFGKHNQQQHQPKPCSKSASSTTTTTTTNGQPVPISLPRGGEEVLINGGGHRSRSAKSSSMAAAVSARHYGKHNLFTSSSIDVAPVIVDSETTTTTKDLDTGTSRSNKSSQQAQQSSSSGHKPATSESNVDPPRQSATNRATTKPQQPPSAAAPTLPGGNRSHSITPLDRNYYHHFQQNPASSLFDEDPGIMSEIETSATGFRRTNKARSSLPVVRTPSKSQDRSMGLVFLQFRSETKRALLPNEITTIDTVKALFVRSFPRQLTMEYLDHISVRIYIHDPAKDMFYELEDLRDVKDRCILRIYEQGVNGPQPGGGIAPQSLMAQTAPTFGGGGEGESYGYFSEPEFDSEYQSQHIHRPKRFPPPPQPPPIVAGQSLMIGQSLPQSQYYGTIMLPPQYRSATLGPRSSFFIQPSPPPPQPPTRNKPYSNYSQTLPRGTHLMSPANPASMNPFGLNHPGSGPPPPKPQRTFPNNAVPQPDIIMIQSLQPRPSAPTGNDSQPPMMGPYHQNRPLPDRPYSVAGHYPTIDRARFSFAPTAGAAAATGTGGEFSGYLSSPEHRAPPNPAALMSLQTGQLRASFSGYPSARLFDPSIAAAAAAAAAAAGVMPNPAVYGTRHPVPSAAPTGGGVIDDEARVRMQEMERKIASLTNVVSKALTTGPKPPPPPKPPSLVGYRPDPSNAGSGISADHSMQLRQIRRKARDLRSEVRQLKRFTLQQINSAKETLKDNCAKIQSTLSLLTKPADAMLRLERLKISANCDAYNEDAFRLDKDLLELEAQVEALRSNVINRRCRVNMSNVESMAHILSRASKTVADLKARYPLLAQNLKIIMAKELQEIEKEEKFLKEEPERLEQSLKRCKKLTGTLVTLKRLASVQEQRSSSNVQTSSPSSQMLQSSLCGGDKNKDSGGSGDENSTSVVLGTSHRSTTAADPLMTRSYDVELMEPHTIIQVTPATPSSTDSSSNKAHSTMLDNLLDELQTFSKQASIESTTASPSSGRHRSSGSFRSTSGRNMAPGDSDTVIRKASRSKSYSSIRATSEPPGVRARGSSVPDGKIDLDSIALLASTCGNAAAATAALVEKRFAQSRQELLEQRHQELLHKQRQLQEQYTRLQQLSKRPMSARGNYFLNELKKTGSESNLASKSQQPGQDSNARSAPPSQSHKSNRILINSTVHGSLHNLSNPTTTTAISGRTDQQQQPNTGAGSNKSTNRKTFETDIL